MLREFLVVAALVVAGAGAFAWYLTHRHGPQSGRPLGGPNTDVSHDGWAQFEVSAAVDPRSPRVLLAGSNDSAVQNRVYTSTDGGRTWDSRPGPPLPTNHPCGLGDPAVAIGPDGREYYALLVDARCNGAHLHLYVATRAGPHGRWRTRRVEPQPAARYVLDDKPAIAVDGARRSRWRGRAYLAWTRWYGKGFRAIAVSHSDDGGRTWSLPVKIAYGRSAPIGAALAVGPNGLVYLAFEEDDAGTVKVTRSPDGGRSFAPPREIVAFRDTASRPCYGEDANISAIPAQIARCVSPLPQIAVALDGTVYVTYADQELNRTQGVYVTWLTSELSPAPPARVGPVDPMPSDQFWPALAVDRQTGDIWVCYYDTTGDRRRRKTWFTCSVSRDGLHWAPPVRAAEAPSDESGHDSDENQYGDYEAVVAARGVAHPFWTDSRDLIGGAEEIYTASIRAAPLLH